MKEWLKACTTMYTCTVTREGFWISGMLGWRVEVTGMVLLLTAPADLGSRLSIDTLKEDVDGTLKNSRGESLVTKRLNTEEPRLPFY